MNEKYTNPKYTYEKKYINEKKYTNGKYRIKSRQMKRRVEIKSIRMKKKYTNGNYRN